MNEKEFLSRFKQGQRDFRKIVLRRANLANAELSLIVLDEANLEHTNFQQAQLAGANLTHAHLSQANFSYANLLGANFFKANLRRAKLSHALLSGAELTATDLRYADLSDASCVGVDLSGANLQDAILTNANLQQANLMGANLLGANMDGADLEGTSLEGAILPDGSSLNFTADSDELTITDLTQATAASVKPENLWPSASADSRDADSGDASQALVAKLRFGDLMLDTQGNIFNPAEHPELAATSETTDAEIADITQLEADSPPAATQEVATQTSGRSPLERVQVSLNQPIPYHFKQSVLRAYGQRCAMTGNPIQAVLEVVMIDPNAESDVDHPSNGLVLRADLAKLFRLRLLAIQPNQFRIVVAPGLQHSEYTTLSGQKLHLPKQASERPRRECLEAFAASCNWNMSAQGSQGAQAASLTEPVSKWRSRFSFSRGFVDQVNQFLQGQQEDPPISKEVVLPPDNNNSYLSSDSDDPEGIDPDLPLDFTDIKGVSETKAVEDPSEGLAQFEHNDPESEFTPDVTPLQATADVAEMSPSELETGQTEIASTAVGDVNEVNFSEVNVNEAIALPSEPVEQSPDTFSDEEPTPLAPLSSSQASGQRWRWVAITASIIVALVGAGAIWQQQRSAQTTNTDLSPGKLTAPVPSPASPQTPDEPGEPVLEADTTADVQVSLQPVTGAEAIELQGPAAEAFLEMKAAAQADGVDLLLLGGYVPESEAITRLGNAASNAIPPKRRALVLKSGYTDGLGIDLGDLNSPESDRNTEFRHTAAYKWLERNGPTYGFTLPFPPNSSDDAPYRPWNWRYTR